MTNQEIKEFAEYLAKAGVIDGKRQKALSAIQPEKARAAAFGTVFTEAFERIKTLEQKARTRGYREAEMKIMESAVDALVSFAKGNADKVQNRDVSSLRSSLTSFENDFIMITYEEGDTIMNIRENAQQIVQTYQDSLYALRAQAMGSRENEEVINNAERSLRTIRENLSKVADGSTTKAAELEKQLCAALGEWGSKIAFNEFQNNTAARALEKAVQISGDWVGLQVPTEKGGLFKRQPKEAAEGDYVTAESLAKDSVYQQILNLAQIPDAKRKIEELPRLIQNTRQSLSSAGLESKKGRLEQKKAEQSTVQAELQAIALRYQLARDKKSKEDPNVVGREMMAKKREMERCAMQVKTLTSDVTRGEAQIKSRLNVIDTVQNLYDTVCDQLDNPALVVYIAEQVQFNLIYKILGGNANEEEIFNFTTNFAVIQAKITEMITSSVQVETGMDGVMADVDAIASELEEQIYSTQTNGQTQNSLDEFDSFLATLQQSNAQEEEVQIEDASLGEISLDGIMFGNDT